MIYLRGRYFWMKFRWKGRLVRESTRAEDFDTAKECEKIVRRRLALEYVRDLKLHPSRYPKSKSFLDWQMAKIDKAVEDDFRARDAEAGHQGSERR